MTQLPYKVAAIPTEDARAVRSRDALRTALLELLENRQMEQIAVRDIARAAAVGHATFYRHYTTKEALLEDVAADEIRRLVDLSVPLLDDVNSAAACSALCHYVYEHRKLWTTLLTGGAAGVMKEELLRIARELAAERQRSNHRLPPDLAVVLSVSSIVELLVWWLRQENPMPQEEVARILDQVIIAPMGVDNRFETDRDNHKR